MLLLFRSPPIIESTIRDDEVWTEKTKEPEVWTLVDEAND